jgi:hypothetical protein
MVVGILRLAANAPKLAKRIPTLAKDGSKITKLDYERTPFTDKEIFKNKMRGQINTTAAGGSSGNYDPNFVGPRKGIEAIMQKNYTGGSSNRQSVGEKATGLKPVMMARLHTAQDMVRGLDKNAIKNLNDAIGDNNLVETSKQFNVYKRGQGNFANTDHLLDYVKRGVKRHGSMYRNPGLLIHPDFIVPPELNYMVDFRTQFKTGNVPGIMSNFVRNNSYHKHYENNLYRYLTEKKLINQAYKDGMISKKRRDADLKKADEFISKIKKDMTNLGLESKVYNKKKMGFDTYGKRYDGEYSGLYKDQMKNYKLELPPASAKGVDSRQHIEDTYNMVPGLKPFGHKEGGLIDDDLTDTVPPKKGPMSKGLPLLDPQESIDRQKFVVGGMASAAKLFGQMKKVPRAVARVGDILKQKNTPGKATDVAISQAPEDKPAMFLSTIDAIEDMPETSLPAKQWLGTIKNKQGVSDVELDEFGLGPLLENISKKDAKRKLSKTELLELYNKEMPKIDMDIAMAEPVSRGVKDLTNTLLRTRELRGNAAYGQSNELDLFSDNPALLTRLHQPPQDATGMKIRRLLIDNMQGAQIQDGDNMIPLLKKSYGGRSFDLYTGSKFNDIWGNTFPKLYHGTNKIVKQDHFNILKNLVPAKDVTKLAQAKNIPEDQAFNELYQALNVFDREVMTADVPIPFWTKKMLYRMGDMADGRGFFYKSKKSPAHDGAQFIPGGSGYGELKFYHNFDTGATRSREKPYASGHFSDEGFEGKGGNAPFGWGRFSERIDENGRKILLMEEVQSDLHQNVAQKGYIYAPRLDKGDVLAEMGDFASQLDKKRQTLESTRLRKDNILALPRAEREAPENVAELANIERAMKKLVEDVKKLQKKVQDQARTTGSSGQMHQEAPFKKSENYAKVFLQGLMKMADDSGYDGIALSTGKMKKAHGNIPKGGDKFYDEIGVKAMKRIAKKSGFKFTDTTIVDGNGFTWEKIPLIELRNFNTGVKYPGSSTIPVYSKGGFVKRNVVRG